MTPYLLVVADVASRPDDADVLGSALRELAEACRDEPGCLSYDLYRSVDEPHRYVSVEKYVDSAAFEAHRTSAHFARLGAEKVMPLLTSRDVQVCADPKSAPAVQQSP
jgi:quinol monooxygenase YgiN